MYYLVEDDSLKSSCSITERCGSQSYFVAGSLCNNTVTEASTFPHDIQVSTLDTVLQVSQPAQIATVYLSEDTIESGTDGVYLALVAGRLTAGAAAVPCRLETSGTYPN
jgi:hypothetical protein